MRFVLILSVFLSVIFTHQTALASHSADCDIKLHTFNRLNMKIARTFSGKANYIFMERSILESSFYQKIHALHDDVCRPEVSGNSIDFPKFISNRVLSKTYYVGTLLFRTGKYDVINSDIKFIKSKMKSASGLLIVGRASTPGSRVANRQLSARRALEVANYFTGVTSATVIALGDAQTREELNNPHHDNRRVDIYAYQ